MQHPDVVEEFPPRLRPVFRHARRMARWTVAYLVSVGLVLFVVLGNSQAMKAACLETVFSLVSPIVFLIGSRVARRPADRRFPYGYHRWVSIAFLCAALSLFALGLYLLADAGMKALAPQPTVIGSISVLGHEFWLGWPMLLALAWSAIPAWFIGRRQARRAWLLHDKVLSADAELRKADWLSALAAAIAVAGIAGGWPWLDPLAGAVIALLVLRSGWRQLVHAAGDLADSAPTHINEHMEALPARIATRLRALPWVMEAEVRLREEGHLLFGEASVLAQSDDNLRRHVADAVAMVRSMDWRIRSFSLTVLPPEAGHCFHTGAAPQRPQGTSGEPQPQPGPEPGNRPVARFFYAAPVAAAAKP